MLSISQQQLDSLAEGLEHRFRQRLADIVETHFPADVGVLPPGADGHSPLSTLVAQILQRAETVGIEEDEDLAVFAVLLMSARQIGTQDQPLIDWMRSILELDDVSGAGKVFLIDDGLHDMLRDRPHAAALWTRIQAVKESVQ